MCHGKQISYPEMVLFEQVLIINYVIGLVMRMYLAILGKWPRFHSCDTQESCRVYSEKTCVKHVNISPWRSTVTKTRWPNSVPVVLTTRISNPRLARAV